jgi:hypothetical protein
MTQPQSPTAHRAGPLNALFGAGIGDKENMVGVLDEAIPLQGASHADVVEYLVESPMRYAECFALLSDGRKVGLRDPRGFVGWSRHDRDRSLLFRSGGKHYEVTVEASLLGQAPGCMRQVSRKFIGIDGNLVVLPVLPATN